MDGSAFLPPTEVANMTSTSTLNMPQNEHSLSAGIPSGRVAIVVVTHKYCFPLERCLASLSDLVEAPGDVIFVDNGSNGEMTDWIRDHFPDVSLVELSNNVHFCGGYNAGLRLALDRGYKFALIVNADTEVCHPMFLKRLLEAADRHPRAAFLGPRVFIRKERQIQNTILRFPSFYRNVKSWFTSRFFKSCPSAIERECAVDFLNGVCVLCRLDAIRQVGLLDENLAAYVEDTDWHWRAKEQGWSSLFIPVPSIIHHQAEKGYENYSLNSFLLRRNTVYWHVKCGRIMQARLYAILANSLARFRLVQAWITGGPIDQHRYYLLRSTTAYRKLIRKEQLGEWFGPMHGSWSPPD